ncbi:MAG: hypothetical protein L3J43_04855 [Sulfurovum sp.]|nr:hypothetical protein [Sulfurovum sp.]
MNENEAQLELFRIDEVELMELWKNYLEVALEDYNNKEEYKSTIDFMNDTISSLATGTIVEVTGISDDMMYLFKNFLESFEYEVGTYKFTFGNIIAKGTKIEDEKLGDF